MNIGFIGAGNVGCSLGRYFIFKKVAVAGYYSRSSESAAAAANLTNTTQFETIDEIVKTCDTLFLTVPDSQIENVWNEIKSFPIQEKVICHCSGALSADIFSEIHERGACGYSIHPMFPFNSKTTSYENIENAFFTVEGSEEKREAIATWIRSLGNSVKVLNNEDKIRYHAAAVMASNEVVALFYAATELLRKCHFTEEEALHALRPLAVSNLENILNAGPKNALTGPVERNDAKTVAGHLTVFDEDQLAVYKACSRMLLQITKWKYPDRNEMELKELLEEKTK